ncbi:hypothetical protein ACFL2Q_07795 [Thermodesulfobacteriota bacterium]
MGLMSEYLGKGWRVGDYHKELARLIDAWNKLRNSFLLIYAVNVEKPHDHMLLTQEDFYL